MLSGAHLGFPGTAQTSRVSVQFAVQDTLVRADSERLDMCHALLAWPGAHSHGVLGCQCSFWLLLVLMPALKLQTFLDPKLDTSEKSLDVVFRAQRRTALSLDATSAELASVDVRILRPSPDGPGHRGPSDGNRAHCFPRLPTLPKRLPTASVFGLSDRAHECPAVVPQPGMQPLLSSYHSSAIKWPDHFITCQGSG